MKRTSCHFFKKLKKELFPITILLVSIFTCHKIDHAYNVYKYEGEKANISNSYDSTPIYEENSTEVSQTSNNNIIPLESGLNFNNSFAPTVIKEGVDQLRSEILSWKQSRKYIYSIWYFE